MESRGSALQPRRQLERVQLAQGLQDLVIREEPLQIRMKCDSSPQSFVFATVLRTPGDDFELILGYLFSLKLLQNRRDIRELSYCSAQQDYNTVTVTFRGDIPAQALSLRSPEWIHGGCGACGQGQIDDQTTNSVPPPNEPVSKSWLHNLPGLLNQAQPLFRQCGGVHAAALTTPGQGLERLYEDVGRHNAVDKLIGSLLQQDRLPAHHRWLLLSGRAGFELVQKAVTAGFSGVASLGPPSSLAIRYAQQAQLTLVGFLSKERFNVYHGPTSDRWVD